jgi:hypothetical protein
MEFIKILFINLLNKYNHNNILFIKQLIKDLINFVIIIIYQISKILTIKVESCIYPFANLSRVNIISVQII